MKAIKPLGLISEWPLAADVTVDRIYSSTKRLHVRGYCFDLRSSLGVLMLGVT